MTESQKKASGTLQVERRTWDKEKYEQRARDRLDHGDEFVDGEKAKASSSFAQASFVAQDGTEAALDLDDPEFWSKVHVRGTLQDVPCLLLASRPRSSRRKPARSPAG